MKESGSRSYKDLFCIILLFWYLIHFGDFSKVSANEIHAAVATNFYKPFQEIANVFQKNTRFRVQIISGSSGKLYAQIVNGAPFELFLAADKIRPALLEAEGKAVFGSRFTYALGKITLWSPNPKAILEDGESTLRKKNFKHLAMANPKTAPYGKAALQILQKLDLWKDIKFSIVTGENIGQTFQFVASRNACLGFVALSQVLDPKNKQKGKKWDFPVKLYDPLEQDVVILKAGKKNPGVKKLWQFLRSPTAKRIIKNYGYGLKLKEKTSG